MQFDPISNSFLGKMEKQTQIGNLTDKFGGRDKLDPQNFIDGKFEISPDSKTASVFEQSVYEDRKWMVDCNPSNEYKFVATSNIIDGARCQFRDVTRNIWVVVGLNASGIFIAVSSNHGDTWVNKTTLATYTDSDDIITVTEIDNVFYIVLKDKIYSSANPITTNFTVFHTADSGVLLTNFKKLNGRYIIMTNKNIIKFSTNLTVWKNGRIGGLEKWAVGTLYQIIDIDYDSVLDEYILIANENIPGTNAITYGVYSTFSVRHRMANNICWIVRFKSLEDEILGYTGIQIGDEPAGLNFFNTSNIICNGFRVDNKYLITTKRGLVIYTDGYDKTKIVSLNKGMEPIVNFVKYKGYYMALMLNEYNSSELNMNKFNYHLAVSKDLENWRVYQSIYIAEKSWQNTTTYDISYGMINQAYEPEIYTPLKLVTESGSILTIDIPETEIIPRYSEAEVSNHCMGTVLPVQTIVKKDNIIVASYRLTAATTAGHYMLSEDNGLTYTEVKLPTTITSGFTAAFAIWDIILFENKFYATVTQHSATTPYSRIISSTDGKNWVLETTNTVRYCENLNIVDNKIVAVLRGVNSPTNIDVMQRETNGTWAIKSTIANVINTTAASKLIKTPDAKYCFSVGGRLWKATAITGTYTSSVLTSDVASSIALAFIYSGLTVFTVGHSTLGPILFVSSDGSATFRPTIVLSTICKLPLDAVIVSTFIDDNSINLVFNTGLVMKTSDFVNFTFNNTPHSNRVLLDTYASYFDPISKTIYLGTTGHVITHRNTKFTPAEFFMKNWNIYGFEEISPNGNIYVEGASSSINLDVFNTKIATPSILTEKFDSNDIVPYSDDPLLQSVNGSTRLIASESYTLAGDYVYWTGVSGYPTIQYKNKNADIVSIPIDPAQMGVHSKVIYDPMRNIVMVIGLLGSNINTLRIAYGTHPLQSLTYVNYDTWVSTSGLTTVNTNNDLYSGIYFAGSIVVQTMSHKLLVIDNHLSTTNWKIIDFSSQLAGDPSKLLYSKDFTILDNNLYFCMRHTYDTSKPNLSVNSVGAIFKIDSDFNVTRVAAGFSMGPYSGQTLPNNIVPIPSTKYLTAIVNKLFTYSRDHFDITYLDGRRILPIPGKCPPHTTVNVKNMSDGFIEVNNDGTLITMKTGNKVYQARQPRILDTTFEIKTIKSDIKPLIKFNAITMTGNSDVIAIIDNGGKIYRYNRTPEWDTTPESMLETTPIDTGFIVDLTPQNTINGFMSTHTPGIAFAIVLNLSLDLYVFTANLSKKITITDTVNITAVSDICIINNDMYVSTISKIFKITNFTTTAVVTTELAVADVNFTGFQALKYFAPLNALVSTGPSKTNGRPLILVYNITTKTKVYSTKVVAPSSYSSWEIYTDSEWIYLSGTANDNCIYKTKDNINFYPINTCGNHNGETLNNGVGGIMGQYIINQHVFTPKLQIIDKITGTIQFIPVDEYSNGFPILINNSSFLFNGLSGLIYLISKKKTNPGKEISLKEINMLDRANGHKLNYISTAPISPAASNGRLTYVNNVYFLKSLKTNTLFFSYDLINWEKIILPMPAGMTSMGLYTADNDTENRNIQYSEEFGWLITGVCGTGLNYALTLSYGQSLHNLTTRQISAINAGYTYGCASIQVNNRGIYLFASYSCYYLENPTATIEVIFDRTNYVTKGVNYPHRPFLFPLKDIRRTGINEIRGLFINAGSFATTPTIFHGILNSDGTITSNKIYTYQSATDIGYNSRPFIFKGIFGVILETTSDENSNENSQIIALSVNDAMAPINISTGRKVANGATITSVSSGKEAMIAVPYNKEYIYISFDVVNWGEIVRIPDYSPGIEYGYDSVYNPDTNEFIIITAKGRIYSLSHKKINEQKLVNRVTKI